MLQDYCRIELPKLTLRKNSFLFLQNRNPTGDLFSPRIADLPFTSIWLMKKIRGFQDSRVQVGIDSQVAER